MYEQDQYLEHYGVKGMKWGVRKKRDRSGIDKAKAGIKRARTNRRNDLKKGKLIKGAVNGTLNIRNAKKRLRGERIKYRYQNRYPELQKYDSKDLRDFNRRYGRKATKRLAKNTRKGKVDNIYQQQTRENVRKVAKWASSVTIRQLLRRPDVQAKLYAGAAAVATGALNYYMKKKAPKGPDIPVRNLHPIGALPSGYRISS